MELKYDMASGKTNYVLLINIIIFNLNLLIKQVFLFGVICGNLQPAVLHFGGNFAPAKRNILPQYSRSPVNTSHSNEFTPALNLCGNL